MRLGIGLPLASSDTDLFTHLDWAVAADDLGYDAVWVPEAYGADAVSLLATIAARTSRIGIASAVMQIPARSAALTGMTAATLNTLSGGRFRLGLGVSGPQVSEGWHGVRFADPVGRMEEYVHIVRTVLARRRLTAGGEHFTLPLPDSAGKALVLALAGQNLMVPIYLAAVGPRNLALTGRIADGWLGIFFDAHEGADQVDAIRSAARDAGREPDAVDLAVQVPISLGSTPEGAADPVRAYAALYIGGMGSRRTNFYHRIATAMGYGTEADLVQERFLGRDYDGAAAAVPLEFLQRTCLIGDEADIAAGLQRLADAGITTVNLNPIGARPGAHVELLETVRRLARERGLWV